MIGLMAAFAAARLDEDATAAADPWYIWPAVWDSTLNPERVLRDIESTRLLIAEILSYQHDYNGEDEFYSCSQAVSSWNGDPEPGSGCSDDDRRGKPCDCGRDRQVKHMLAIIILRWNDHPGYLAEWKP